VSLKPVLIFQKELLKIMEDNKVKHRAFLVMLPIDPAHGRDSDSRNRPVRRIAYFPLLTAKPVLFSTLFGPRIEATIPIPVILISPGIWDTPSVNTTKICQNIITSKC